MYYNFEPTYSSLMLGVFELRSLGAWTVRMFDNAPYTRYVPSQNVVFIRPAQWHASREFNDQLQTSSQISDASQLRLLSNYTINNAKYYVPPILFISAQSDIPAKSIVHLHAISPTTGYLL